MAYDYETVLVDIADGVATVTLNRPDKLNAFNGRLSADLHYAFGDLDEDDDVRAIVVTGAGRAFSAGADLEGRGGDTFAGMNRGGEVRAWRGEAQPRRRVPVWRMSTPVIAAINGAAVGMGLTLPMSWDIRIAADDAKLGFVFNRRGVIPEANALWMVPRLAGMSNALELLYSGRYFTGKEAAEIGLVSRALPRDEVLANAQQVGRDIAEAAPVSVAMTKRLVWQFLQEPDRSKSQAFETKMFAWSGEQVDSKEGVTAFLQKRKPEWKMSKTRDLPDELK